MGEAMEKSNTDCVYFLASPLTCKKGSECEYRHSESARLNPRDCWYWLNNACLNPSCAFRHPPLKGLAPTVPEPSQPPSHLPIPATKTNVPCYFYFHAYCIKGDQCPFVHEAVPAQKFTNPAPETTISHHAPENKASSGSDTGPASIEVPPNPPGPALERITQGQTKKEPSAFTESSAPDLVETGVKPLEENLLPPIEEYPNASPQIYPDEGSDEISKQSAEGDEWLESSPGFDVLVDDASEQLVYEEDADYILAQERVSEMLHFDYEVPPGYDNLDYSDASYLHDHGMCENYDHENYDHEDNQHTPEYFPRVSKHLTRRRDLEPKSHQKRKPSRRRHEDVSDLRHYLQKRQRTSGSPRKRHVSRTGRGSRELPGRGGMGPRLFGGRLGSEVDNNMHQVFRYPQFTGHARSRHGESEDRKSIGRNMPFILSEILRPSASRTESTQIKSSGATFSGPKTLEQIKEEKRRAWEADGISTARHDPRNPRRQGFIDFEGPKPLNELLEVKRRSVVASIQEHHASEDGAVLKKRKAGYENDFVDEDEDDEDAIREKLVGILSS